MAEEKDDWLDDLDDSDEQESELGQSDIDSLFSGVDEETRLVNEGDELGQADIDSLLSGDELAPEGQDSGDSVSGNLDQADIEALLSSSDVPGQDQPFVDPDQDEIDKLFSEPDAGDLTDSQAFPAEELDFGDAFDSPDFSSSEPSSSPSPDFDDNEFKLEADIPDIPDIPDISNSSSGWDEKESFLDEVTVAIPDEPAVAAAAAVFAENERESDLPQQAKWRKLLANRKLLFAAGGGGGLLILLVAGLFFFKGGGDAPQENLVPKAPVEVVVEEPVAEEQSQAPPVAVVEAEPQQPSVPDVLVATPPTLSDLNLVMPEGSSELAITLEGRDQENHPLEYEIQSKPLHGQISGKGPLLIYSASADFAGQDSFTVRASNGKLTSPAAKITISREKPLSIPEPPAVAAATEVVQEQAPPSTAEVVPIKQESISARNASYTISHSLAIPWEKIWKKVNSQPYTGDVGVEIIQGPRHGSLGAMKGRKSVYRPDDSFNGNDTIRYRFTLGELRSATKTVAISVKRKNRSPELHIAPYSDAYNPGDTVILNASQTTDDSRDTLRFDWQQVSGVPVVIKSLNSEGSQISFVAPSTFNTVSNPGVVFRVTAIDEKGWRVSRELQVRTQSRRSTAIWR